MNEMTDPAGLQGLQFFGSTTASISHELKNALAIIKENAGLLNDYMVMIDKGSPVAPDRMKIVAGRIEGQVLRADRLIKTLNRYAHTVDNDDKDVDLNDLLDLFAAISSRPAAMRQVGLQCRPAAAPVMIRTAPFVLLTVLGQCLIYMLSIARPGQDVIMGTTAESGGGIYMQLPVDAGAVGGDAYPDAKLAPLLAALGASSTWDPVAGRINVHLQAE